MPIDRAAASRDERHVDNEQGEEAEKKLHKLIMLVVVADWHRHRSRSEEELLNINFLRSLVSEPPTREDVYLEQQQILLL